MSVLYICHGLNVEPHHSSLTTTTTKENSESNNNPIDEYNDDPTIVALDNNSNSKRLLSHHLIQSFDEIDKEQLIQQTTKMSAKQKEKNAERMEEIQEIFNWLQTNMPLPDIDHIHGLLHNIVNNTLLNEMNDINTTLSEMELLREYLHQIDNAIDFGKMGGLAIMLQLVLEYPSIEIRTSAVWTIGLSCQNNPILIEIAHNISIVQNILYMLKLSSSGSTLSDTYSINLFDKNSVHYLSKLIWTLSSLTRQNDNSYSIFREMDGTDIIYDWIMEIYNFWDFNQNNIKLLNDNYKNRVIEKILMFASDVVILNPEEYLFIDQKWCDVFAAHFNYALSNYILREVTIAYWDVAIKQLFCLNCIPFGNNNENITNPNLSIDIGLNKLINMEIDEDDEDDEYDLEYKNKAKQMLHTILNFEY